MTSSHGRNRRARQAMARLVALFRDLTETAEQLTATERWCRILSRALIKYLHGRDIKPPGHLLPA